MEAKNLLKDKKFWFASFLIAWAAALQVNQIQIFIRSPTTMLYTIHSISEGIWGIVGVGVGAGAHDVGAEAGIFQAEVR